MSKKVYLFYVTRSILRKGEMMADHVEYIGQQFGDYRLIRWLGGGGFGTVYLGEHIRDNGLAAVKVLQMRLTQSEDLKGFINEARTFRLKHPNIVQLLDFGIAVNDTPFLIMAYAPHGTLRQLHQHNTRIPLATVVTYIKYIASALQYAHDVSLIHRDVKPENMLLGPQSEVLLSDFGISLMAQSSRYQSTQQIAGTAAYMAPEQIEGKPRPASDQYALGIVVYEWLSGDRPFHGSFKELCAQHMFTAPTPLCEKLPDIPKAVEEVVATALAKEPKQRFGSIQAFANALEQAHQISSPPVKKLEMPKLITSITSSPIIPNAPVRPIESSPVTEVTRVTSPYVPTLQHKSDEQWWQEGNTHYKAKRYEDALAAYDEAIKINPRNALAYNSRGIITYTLKQYERAIADFAQAIQINPVYAVAYNNSGLAHLATGDYQKAINNFNYALQLDANNATILNSRGNVYLSQKRYQKAISDFTQAIQMKPKHIDAFIGRGNAHFYLRQYQNAIADYQEAIQLDAKCANAYYGRGIVYLTLKEYLEAIADFQQVIQLSPAHAEAYAHRGEAYQFLKDYHRAVQDFDCALQINQGLDWVIEARRKAHRLM